MPVGIYKFLSFLSMYYLVVSSVDLYGSYLSFKARVNGPDNKDFNLKVDFNSDLAAICSIYLFSYYFGVFD